MDAISVWLRLSFVGRDPLVLERRQTQGFARVALGFVACRDEPCCAIEATSERKQFVAVSLVGREDRLILVVQHCAGCGKLVCRGKGRVIPTVIRQKHEPKECFGPCYHIGRDHRLALEGRQTLGGSDVALESMVREDASSLPCLGDASRTQLI